MAETQSDIAQYQTDHDLLVELRTEFRGMREDLKEIRDDTKERLGTVEHGVENLTFWRGVSQGVGLCVIFLIAALGWLFVSYFQFSSGIDARIQRDITGNLQNYGLIKN